MRDAQITSSDDCGRWLVDHDRSVALQDGRLLLTRQINPDLQLRGPSTLTQHMQLRKETLHFSVKWRLCQKLVAFWVITIRLETEATAVSRANACALGSMEVTLKQTDNWYQSAVCVMHKKNGTKIQTSVHVIAAAGSRSAHHAIKVNLQILKKKQNLDLLQNQKRVYPNHLELFHIKHNHEMKTIEMPQKIG